jgi:AcrR family transcriptional regulator
MARGQPIQARAESTRIAILKAAEAVFAEKGFAGCRLREVAERVNIRRPSIVYHFRDKRELYDAVIERLLGGLMARIQAALAGDGPLGARLEAVLLAGVTYLGERPSLARIVLREVAEASPARNPAVMRHVTPIIAAVQEAIRTGQQDRILQPMDPIRFMFSVAGATVFLIAGTPVLAPESPFDPLDGQQLAAHKAEVLQMMRRWLGTHGRRPEREKKPKR